MEATLIVGYGNADRQDDGVAFHVLAALAQRLGRPVPSLELDFDAGGESPELLFALQLTPELAEMLAMYRRVAFVDAHTGRVPQEINIEPLTAEFKSSPLTHHLTPQTCLALADKLYGGRPEAWLISVRGYEFGFSRQLSPRTQALVAPAVQVLWDWLFE